MAPGTYWLLYDGDCRICTAVARWAAALDPGGRLRARSIQASRDLLGDMPEAGVLAAYHVVAPDGRITTGGDAVPTMVEAYPMGAGFARLLRGSSVLMGWIRRLYGFATRFRDVLICRVDASGAARASPRP